jgi:NADPH-dependent 2,4-dienoyl-CoA reductase/sulfur reductase-like enzyme
MPGKNVLVLGSGDVGLIMARRLKFEGANVLGVVEIFPYANGLPRNIVQCLDDYKIPLYLNHTVTCIHGQDRLEAVTISEVDESSTPIKGSEQQVPCDTLLLSLGLIPEHELSKQAGVKLDISTGGPFVNQWFETSIEGVFACGNCLQVYDTVDMLAIDAQQAGKHAAEYSVQQQQKKIPRRVSQTQEKKILPGKGVQTVLPQRLNIAGKLHITIRASKPSGVAHVNITAGNKTILKKRLRFVNPANMITIDSTISNEILRSNDDLEVSIQ